MAFEMLSLSPALIKDSVLALAAITKYEAFNSLMYAGALIGFVGLILSLSTKSGNTGQSIKLFLISYFVFILGAKAEVDMVVTSPVTGESYAISDAPAGIAILGWGTSAVGKIFKDMYSTEMTPVGLGEVLTRNGAGRGLAVITGMQGVGWTNRSRTVGNTGTNTTNIEQSIHNYLLGCFNPMVDLEGGGIDRWSALHERGDASTLNAIWVRLQAPVVRTVPIFIDGPKTGTSMMCWDAWTAINSVISSPEFSTAITEDGVDHYAKQLAAMSMPGASVSLSSGSSTAQVRTQLKLEADALLTAMFGGTSMRERILFLDRLNLMLLDAFGASPRAQVEDAAGRLGSAWDDAKRQADLSMAAEGDWWTRNAKPMTQYLELIVLGFLPILLFLMFATPNGMKAVAGIVFVYFWLQSWPIAYIILNHASMGSMMATFDQFLSSTSVFGMEDMYNLWDQARHSYAVSQSLLGMTPILTGAMLSGSMMMLTKLAGGMGSSENLDESRVYNDTESSASMYQGQSQTGYQVDKTGNVIKNADLSGTDTSINVSDTLNNQTASAKQEKEVAAANHSKDFNNTVGRAVQEMDTQQLNQIISKTTAFNEGFESSAITSSAESQTAATSWVDTNAVKMAADLKGSVGATLNKTDTKFLDKVQDGDGQALSNLTRGLQGNGSVSLAASAGISNTLAAQLTQQYQESEEFRTALTQKLSSAESFNDQDSLSELASVSEAVSEQDVESLKESYSNMQAKEKSYSEVNSRAGAISSSRTIDEGRQWQIMDKIEKDMVKRGGSKEGEEQKEAMIERAMELGADEKTALRMAEAIQGNLGSGYEPSNAGIHRQGAGMLGFMRDKLDEQSVNSLIIKNDDRMFGNEPSNSGNLIRPTDNVNTSGVPEYGAVTDLVTPKIQKDLDKPNEQLTGDAEKKAAALREEVNSKVNYQEKMKAVQEEIAKRANDIKARGDGEHNVMDHFSGGATELSLSGHEDSLQEIMINESMSRALEVINGASIAADLAMEAGLDESEQQWTADRAMSNLLRGNDKNDFDKMAADGKRDEAQKFLQNKLTNAGIQGDLESLNKFSDQIDSYAKTYVPQDDTVQSDSPAYHINKLDIFEKIGNAMKGVDNDEVAKIREDLAHQVGNMSESGGYGALAFADDKAEGMYKETHEKLQERREGEEKYLTDVYLSEMMALAPYVAQDDKGEALSAVIEKVKSKSSGLEGGFISGLKSLTAGATGNGQEGASIDRSEIEKIFDQQLGEGAYENYRNMMSNDLKSQINNDEQEIIDQKVKEIKDKMNPESQSLDQENTVREALGRLDSAGQEAAVMREMAKQDPAGLLALESEYATYSPEAQSEVDMSKMVDRLQGEGTYQSFQRDVISNDSKALMEEFKGEMGKMMEMMEEKYGNTENAEYEDWKAEQKTQFETVRGT